MIKITNEREWRTLSARNHDYKWPGLCHKNKTNHQNASKSCEHLERKFISR